MDCYPFYWNRGRRNPTFPEGLGVSKQGHQSKYFKIEIRKQKASRTLQLVRCGHDGYANIIICTLAVHLPKSSYPQLVLKPQLIQSLLKISPDFHPHDIILIFSKYKIIYFTMFYKIISKVVWQNSSLYLICLSIKWKPRFCFMKIHISLEMFVLTNILIFF